MRQTTANRIAAALIAVAALGYAAASIFRHERFASNAYDLGIFDQSVWALSRLELTLDNTVRDAPTPFIDHVQPVLLALAPLYAVWSDPRILLAVQALLVASSGIPLFAWARRELDAAPALCVLAAYLGFWALIAGILFDFHEVAFAPLVIGVALYAALTRSDALLWGATTSAMLVREDLPLTIAVLGLYVAVAQRRHRVGLAVAAVSVAWFVLAVNVIVPWLAGSAYEHWAYYPSVSESLGDPVGTLELLVTPSAKVTLFLNLVGAWLFLPLGSLLAAVAVPSLLERFLSSKPPHWQQGFHYSLPLASILAFSAVDAIRRVPHRFVLVVATALLFAGSFFTAYRMRPLAELTRYPSSERAQEIRECLRTIPGDAAVAATSALVPHLSERERIYAFGTRRVVPRFDYAALDRSTWTFPLTADDVRAVERSLRSGGFRVVCRRGATVVLRRA